MNLKHLSNTATIDPRGLTEGLKWAQCSPPLIHQSPHNWVHRRRYCYAI